MGLAGNPIHLHIEFERTRVDHSPGHNNAFSTACPLSKRRMQPAAGRLHPVAQTGQLRLFMAGRLSRVAYQVEHLLIVLGLMLGVFILLAGIVPQDIRARAPQPQVALLDGL